VLAVLGNHDYTGNALAQQDPAILEVDSRYNSVNKSFIVSTGADLSSLNDEHPIIFLTSGVIFVVVDDGRYRRFLPCGHVAVHPKVLEQLQVRLETGRSSHHLRPKSRPGIEAFLLIGILEPMRTCAWQPS
jgi:hypothetical protein